MSGATLPAADGVVDWIDNTHNWRAEDAEFLQARSVLRFTTFSNRDSALGPSTTIPTPQAGQVAFVGSSEVLSYADTTGQWRDLVTFQNMIMTDTVSSIGFRHYLDGTDSFVIKPGQVVIGPGGQLVADASHVHIQTGAAEALLSTNSTSLVSSIDIAAPSVTVTTLTSAGIDNTGGTLATASLTATGAVQAGTLTVSGTAGFSGAMTTAAINTTGSITATSTITASVSVRGDDVVLEDSVVRSYAHPTSRLTFASGLSTLAADTINLTPTNQTTAVRFKSGTIDIPVATVVVDSNDPGVANYPEGTFWVVP